MAKYFHNINDQEELIQPSEKISLKDLKAQLIGNITSKTTINE
jgi:hypothetical protein